MKKILALLLSVSLLGGCFSAFAITPVNNTDDVTPLYFNDFENCGNFSQYIQEHGIFSFFDTNEENHETVIKVGVSTWAAIQGASHCGKYTWNGVQYTAFNEPLTQNTDYIVAFDYKTENPDQSYTLSFAPQIPNSVFVYSATDYRYNIPISSDWTNYAVKFNSSTATSMNVKINTLASTATTYLDNYAVYEAFPLTVKGLDVKMNVESNFYVDGSFAKGANARISAPEGMAITSAKMNGEAVAVTDGVLQIASVTGAIEITVASDLADLNDNYAVKDGAIYLMKGQSVTEFVQKALGKETYSLVDSNGDDKLEDGIIVNGDKLSIKVNDTVNEQYEFKFFGDTSGKNVYSVTDIYGMVNRVLEKEESFQHDVNGSGRLTVSDVIVLRNWVLNQENYTIDTNKLAEEKAKVEADAATYGITDEMLKASITNVGNRTRVANVMKKALRGEYITIATIGGSITEGTGIAVNNGRAEKCWAALMADWWKRMFPGQVTFVNAGISGTNSNFGLHRLEADVLCHDPDLLFIEFAVNDGAATGSMRSCQEALILKMLERGDAAIQMFFTTVSYNGGGGQSTYQPVGEYYKIPQISPRDAFWGNTFQNADGNTYDFEAITADGTHPNEMGNAMVSVLTNNYLNSVYENLEEIGTYLNAIPEETFEDDTPNYMNWNSYDAGLMTEGVASADGKVTVVDYGCFRKNTDSTSFRSNCAPMYGVKYSEGDVEPMIIDVDDCHIFGIFSHTARDGANVKVEIYKQGTNELIKTDNNVDTNYGGALRSHKASFESIEGTDVTIKITPVVESGRTTANLRLFYIS